MTQRGMGQQMQGLAAQHQQQLGGGLTTSPNGSRRRGRAAMGEGDQGDMDEQERLGDVRERRQQRQREDVGRSMAEMQQLSQQQHMNLPLQQLLQQQQLQAQLLQHLPYMPLQQQQQQQQLGPNGEPLLPGSLASMMMMEEDHAAAAAAAASRGQQLQQLLQPWTGLGINAAAAAAAAASNAANAAALNGANSFRTPLPNSISSPPPPLSSTGIPVGGGPLLSPALPLTHTDIAQPDPLQVQALLQPPQGSVSDPSADQLAELVLLGLLSKLGQAALPSPQPTPPSAAVPGDGSDAAAAEAATAAAGSESAAAADLDDAFGVIPNLAVFVKEALSLAESAVAAMGDDPLSRLLHQPAVQLLLQSAIPDLVVDVSPGQAAALAGLRSLRRLFLLGTKRMLDKATKHAAQEIERQIESCS